jgi:hypothetical protein
LGGNPHDFEDIVNYKGKKVAFFSMGDFVGRLTDAINKYNAMPVGLFVCATNTKFVNPLPFIATFHHHIVYKVKEPNHALRSAADTASADTILKLIKAHYMSLCNFATTHSRTTYRYLSDIFSYRLGMSEVGLTDLFVFHLVDYCHKQRLTNAKIYKTTWPVESVYGNDLDLFIQRPDGWYNRFALQAKVMSYDGVYKDLKLEPAPNQWDKLLNHQTAFGSKAFYLLYNGRSVSNHVTAAPTRADCMGLPSIGDMGLSIVEASVVKSIRENPAIVRPHGKVYMRHFYPAHMDSIRKLFCCDGGGYTSSDLRAYDYKDIYTAAPYRLITPIDPNTKISDEDEEDINDSVTYSLSKERPDLAGVRIVIGKEE